MSPSVLANMWKEEETKTKALENRMRQLLSEKEVKMSRLYGVIGWSELVSKLLVRQMLKLIL